MKKQFLLILSLVMIINSLSYGILIPLLYPYTVRFGLDPIGLALLLASYSLFQFIATPIIGRLSDRYGRKPMLILSLLGTAGSLALFALANSIPMLFISRILDGITGGNNSVAQAVIADKVSGPERTKAFGVLGAAFGIGFVLGPIVGAVLSPIGITTPFWFAAFLAVIASGLTLFLPETLTKKNLKKVKHESLFNFKKMFSALLIPVIGATLLLSLISISAHQAMVIGFQTYIVDVLTLSINEVTILFAVIGVTSIISQLVILPLGLKWFNNKTRFLQALYIIVALVCFAMPQQTTWVSFLMVSIVYAFFFGPQMSVISGIISEATKPEDQGVVLGINQSYNSLGQILGPLVGGAAAGLFSIQAVFITGTIIFAVAVFVAEITNRRAKLVNF